MQSRSETSGFLTPKAERRATKKFIEKTERKVQASNFLNERQFLKETKVKDKLSIIRIYNEEFDPGSG